MADSYLCRECSKVITATKNNRYRTHTKEGGERCEMSSAEIPSYLLEQGPRDPKAPKDVPAEGQDFATCPECGKKVKLTSLGYFPPHNSTLYGGERCVKSGTRLKYPARAGLDGEHILKRTVDVPLPGDSLPEKGVYYQQSAEVSDTELGEKLTDGTGSVVADANLERQPMKELPPAPPAGSSVSTEKSSPESPTTSTPSSELSDPPAGPYSLGTAYSAVILQPFSPFLQPGVIVPKLSVKNAMSERGKEIAARLRETFYAYTNRNSSDNRSAQKTLGPSEIGSPCDRQIAMKLLGIKPVNPQEGWAPFVGTAVHAELAKMFEWANGSGSGRYHIEMSVSFGSTVVPRGTLDLYDGVLYMVDDHKLKGRWSLNKLVQEGPTETESIQLQTYGLGAEQAGFKVREVAIIGWPRQESSLDNLFVHVEAYDRKKAQAAIKRVEQIAADVGLRLPDDRVPIDAERMIVARGFPTGDDCKWCPFHLKNDKGMERGCPGK